MGGVSAVAAPTHKIRPHSPCQPLAATALPFPVQEDELGRAIKEPELDLNSRTKAPPNPLS